MVNLFSPIKINNIEIKNRIAMAPMGNHLQAPDGSPTCDFIDYIVARASGVGLVFSPFTSVAPHHPTPGVYSDRLIPSLSKLCKSVHSRGAKMILQIAHLGAQLFSNPIAPSKVRSKFYEDEFSRRQIPRELEIGEIEILQGEFIKAAKRAQTAGFDGVELHGGYSYLGAEFISPHFNKRKDAYGGNLEGRLKFFSEILKCIKAECGIDYPVGLKFNAYEDVDDGIKPSDAPKIGKYVEKRGADFLHVVSMSWGFRYPSVPPTYVRYNTLADLAGKVKGEVNIPVITEGGVMKLKHAEEILQRGQADIVSVGRSLIADPKWVQKSQQGGLVIPCIRCNICHIKEVLEGKPVRCSVNPVSGRERTYREEPCVKRTNVVVVGGGPAGMEATRVLDNRGFEVTLFERDSRLGGNLKYACVPDFKGDLKDLLAYYREKIHNSGVKVKTNCEVTLDILKDTEPDAIILAVGSRSIIPDIKGIKNIPFTTAIDFLKSVRGDELSLRDIPHETLILGAGLIGCETGLLLAKNGINVKIVDQLSRGEIMQDEHPTNKCVLFRMLKEAGAEIFDQSRVNKVEDGQAFIIRKDKSMTLSFEKLLISVGLESRRELEEEIKKFFPEKKIYKVGDCKEPRRIFEAIQEGNEVARHLECGQ